MADIVFPRLVVVSHTTVQHATHLCRPLVGVVGVAYPHVAVATGLEGASFVLAQRGERAADEALIAAATKTTRAQTWSWSVSEQSGFWLWKRPSLLRGMGDLTVPVAQMTTDGGGIDDLATELLLIPDAMKKAAELLRTDTLFAIVPKRGWLMVAPGEIGNPFAGASLHQMAAGIAERGGRSSIAGNLIVLWKDGKLVGVDGREGSSGFISLQGEDEATWWV